MVRHGALILAAAIVLVAVSSGASAQQTPGPIGAGDTGGAIARLAIEARPRDRLIILGKVSNRASRAQKRLEAMADWLAVRLRPLGIKAGRGRIAGSLGEMRHFLKTGKVDIVTESILGALDMEARAGARILLHERREGRSSYRTVFITRRGSGINSLAGLAGKRIAFEDRGSTSSFLLPMALLRGAGQKMAPLDGPFDEVPPGRVGYVFSGEEINVAAWTARGLVDAGAFSTRDWNEPKITPKRFRDELRTFLVSRPLIRAVVMVRGGMRPQLVRAIERALLEFGSAPDADAVRRKYYGVSHYDKLDGKLRVALEDARKIYESVKDLLR